MARTSETNFRGVRQGCSVTYASDSLIYSKICAPIRCTNLSNQQIHFNIIDVHVSAIHVAIFRMISFRTRIKFEVHPRTGHEGPDGEQMYSSTLSLTSALDGGEQSTPRPGRFTPGKDPVPIVQVVGWAPGPVQTGVKNLASTGIRSPDRPARSQSLYRLSYPGPLRTRIQL